MNGKRKFHKATGPAFKPGEVWLPADGSSTECRIVSVELYPGAITDYLSDYKVTYQFEYEQSYSPHREKDAWNFQVRYMHVADKDL